MAEFRKGWKRIFGESMRRDSARLRGAAIRLTLVGCALPVAAIATSTGGAVMMATGGEPAHQLGIAMLIAGGCGIIASMASLGMMYAAQGLGWWWALAHPMGSFITASIQREAARDLDARKKTEWGGMAYARERGEAS